MFISQLFLLKSDFFYFYFVAWSLMLIINSNHSTAGCVNDLRSQRDQNAQKDTDVTQHRTFSRSNTGWKHLWLYVLEFIRQREPTVSSRDRNKTQRELAKRKHSWSPWPMVEHRLHLLFGSLFRCVARAKSGGTVMWCTDFSHKFVIVICSGCLRPDPPHLAFSGAELGRMLHVREIKVR